MSPTARSLGPSGPPHRSAAAWIERKAGERVDDLAELLAHHYLQALELAEAAGDTEQAEELASRLGVSSRSRASGRSASTPSRRRRARPRARALPGRRSGAAAAAGPVGRRRLGGWPQSGGCRRARGGARPPPAPREQEAEARALIVLADVTFNWAGAATSRSLPRPLVCSSRSRPVRHWSPPTRSSPRQFPCGEHGEAIFAADRALALVETLDLPEPARALGRRGFSRAFLGDPDGVAEMERALAIFLEHGAG